METLDKILNKYGVENKDLIEIPNVTRKDLAKMAHELDFKVGVEVGVMAGLYSEVICRENPQMTVYGVDPWVEQVIREKSSDLPEVLYLQEDVIADYKRTQERMAPYSNYKILRSTSIEAARGFEDNSIDFVYIDADHTFKAVLEDIDAWLPKLRVGGIMSGHDYKDFKRNHIATIEVKQAVGSYVHKHNIAPLIIWGAWKKIRGFKRDSARSWSFIKT